MWCATLKLRRHDLWHLRRIAGDLEVDGRLCSAAFVQVGDAQVVTLENVYFAEPFRLGWQDSRVYTGCTDAFP